MTKNCFLPADILLPKNCEMEKWAVVACDQFSSQPEYWQAVAELVSDAPSTLKLILPESALGSEKESESIEQINKTMQDYIDNDVFETYKDSYIYMERTMENGTVRSGLVGKIDLEAYDFSAGSSSQIRATEKTDVERVKPRVRVRVNAGLELPHVMVLLDDSEKCLIEPIAAMKSELKKVYDFDTMQNGGAIKGWLVDGVLATAFGERLEKYAENIGEKYIGLAGTPMVFAMGDGNHSLATAKACYEKLKEENPEQDFSNHPARYALVELGNIHEEAQSFEPIHRIIMNTEPAKIMEMIKPYTAETGYEIKWFIGQESGTIYLDKNRSELAIGVLQPFIDDYLAENEGEIDYIHGDAVVAELAKKENSIGFLLPTMEKSQLFRGVISDGVLPRKTFSMGHAHEKRYYLECRAIR